MDAQEKYVEEPPTVEALTFTVQQYLCMRGSARTDHFLTAQQPPAPPQNQSNQVQQPVAPPLVPNAQQVPRNHWIIDTNPSERVSIAVTHTIS